MNIRIRMDQQKGEEREGEERGKEERREEERAKALNISAHCTEQGFYFTC